MITHIERNELGELLICEDGVWNNLGHYPDGVPLPPRYHSPGVWEHWTGTGDIAIPRSRHIHLED